MTPKKKLDVIEVKRLDKDLITIELVTINDDLEDFYNHIGCETIDIITRRFGGVLFDVILDDEALLKERPAITSYWQSDDYTPNVERLCGTLLLCHSNEEGELTSATFEDLIAVHMSAREVTTRKEGKVMLLFHEIK